ncbi:Unconventional Myosin-Vb [Manis pentadactyla]|nr:Unconventional Myosin-Vb [Manis pentadactyla]
MPGAPPAPATPQPRAALSARSCRAAAPAMQVSEKDPHAPTRGSRPCPSLLRASRRARVRPPAASAQAPLSRRAPQPSAGPHSILPSWRSGHLPRGCLHPALGSAFGSRVLLPRVPFLLSARPPSESLADLPVLVCHPLPLLSSSVGGAPACGGLGAGSAGEGPGPRTRGSRPTPARLLRTTVKAENLAHN